MARPDRELAQSFTHPGVATAYRHRPPYPQQVFDLLTKLIADEPRRVLDLGAGEGALARPLVPRVEEIDAVDPSEAMIEVGRGRPGGDAANLRWVQAAAESCPLRAPLRAGGGGRELSLV
jgi:2-polyprenyl-3-methyl-5-hydroxy-6-metoxy-1,4-benzoquinol methylase